MSRRFLEKTKLGFEIHRIAVKCKLTSDRLRHYKKKYKTVKKGRCTKGVNENPHKSVPQVTLRKTVAQWSIHREGQEVSGELGVWATPTVMLVKGRWLGWPKAKGKKTKSISSL